MALWAEHENKASGDGPPEPIVSGDNTRLWHAIAYARRGWRVLPLYTVINGQCTCGKDCASRGKHPRFHPADLAHGVKDATTDQALIRCWFERWPEANIGIATGTVSGFDVLDIDPRAGGSENLFDLERKHGELPSTVTASTGGGGSHFFFQHNANGKNRTGAGAIAPGVELKAEGGYIVAPPSLHESGKRYSWVSGCAPGELEIARMPDWLLGSIEKRAARDGHRAPSLQPIVDRIPAGTRNQKLMSLAGSMRERGMSREAINAALRVTNIQRCDPPLGHEEIGRISESASRYNPTEIQSNRRSNQLEMERQSVGWPDPLAAEAMHGPAAQFVRLIEPHSEADPAALLIQFLVGFGNLIGRGAYFKAEADKHYMNLFMVLVGQTSKARKGSSWGQVSNILRASDDGWAKECVKSGLASGEGMIWHVRDAIQGSEPVKEKGRVKEYQVVTKDPGIEDKRLLVIEPEFARVLQVCERESNTLSAIIRQAWDTGDLRVLTKKEAATAIGAHISLIGHITKDELRRLLTDTAAGNGFANRFSWVCAKRSKCLPEGGQADKIDLGPFLHQLAGAIDLAKSAGELKRDEEARSLWREIYPSLSEGKPGLLGAVTSRAEAQTMRLACIYALLDSSSVVRVEHLRAALAVWRYCEASARFIFGDALGDGTADEVLRALRERTAEGMTRWEITEFFQRNRRSAEISRALNVLLEHGLVRFQSEDTGGRPSQRWFAT